MNISVIVEFISVLIVLELS